MLYHVYRGALYSFMRIVPSSAGEIAVRAGEGQNCIYPSSLSANRL